MNDFATQRKWCPTCVAYVPYLQSATSAYCTTCDSKVRLYPEPVKPDYIYFPKDSEVQDIRTASGVVWCRDTDKPQVVGVN